jgi:hypothetical protein
MPCEFLAEHDAWQQSRVHASVAVLGGIGKSLSWAASAYFSQQVLYFVILPSVFIQEVALAAISPPLPGNTVKFPRAKLKACLSNIKGVRSNTGG